MSKQITFYNPFSEDTWKNMQKWAGEFPAIVSEDNDYELFEEGDNLVMKMKVPGFTQNELNIELQDGVLTISGDKKSEEEQTDNSKMYYRKMTSQTFSRSVRLPTPVNSENINAKLKDGLLHVTMSKTQEAKGKKIVIE